MARDRQDTPFPQEPTSPTSPASDGYGGGSSSGPPSSRSSASSRSRKDKKAEKAERRKRAAVDRQFKKAAAAAVKEMDVITAEFQGPRDKLLQRQTVNRRAMEWTRWEEQGFTQDEVKYQLRLDMSLARDKMEKVITEEVQNTAVEQEMDQETLEQLQEEKSQNRWRDWLDGFPASLKRRLPGWSAGQYYDAWDALVPILEEIQQEWTNGIMFVPIYMPDEYVNGKRVRSKLVTHWELQDPAKNRLAVAGEPGSDAPRKMGGRTIPGAPYNVVPEPAVLARTQTWPPKEGVPSVTPLSPMAFCGRSDGSKGPGSNSPNRTESKMAVTAPSKLLAGIDVAAIDAAAAKKAAGEEAAANNAKAEEAKKAAAAEEATEAGALDTPAVAAAVSGGDEVAVAVLHDDQQEMVPAIPDAAVAAGSGGDKVQTLATISDDQQEIACESMMAVHLNQPIDQLETASEQLEPATQEREVCRELESQVRAQMSKKQDQLQELLSSTDQCKRDIGILEAALAQIQA